LYPGRYCVLCTCITGPGTSRPKLAEKDFWNVSIITAWNLQKDGLGSIRFAKEINQHLTDFYSIDKWVVYEDIPEKVTGCKQRKRVKVTKSSTKSHKLIRKSYRNFHIMLLSTFQENFQYV